MSLYLRIVSILARSETLTATAREDRYPAHLQHLLIDNVILMSLHLFDVPIDTCETTSKVVGFSLRQIQNERARELSFVFSEGHERGIHQLGVDDAWQQGECAKTRIF